MNVGLRMIGDQPASTDQSGADLRRGPMDVKTAVVNAKAWLTDVLQDEGIENVGLEEVEFDDRQGLWLITLGFSRPWNTTNNAYAAISGVPFGGRDYRVITVKEPTGEVLAMKRRTEAAE
jgi:hypothetical protein